MGFMSAPPRTEILVYWAQYGALNGALTIRQARVWLVAESDAPDAALKAIIGTNDPDDGHVVYETRDVRSAVIRSAFQATIELVFDDGTRLSQTVAPCVCGAGAIGHAGPTTDRHRVLMLDPRNHDRITNP